MDAVSRRKKSASLPPTDSGGSTGSGRPRPGKVDAFWQTATPAVKFIVYMIAEGVERDFGMPVWSYILHRLATDPRIRIYYDKAYATWFQVADQDDPGDVAPESGGDDGTQSSP